MSESVSDKKEQFIEKHKDAAMQAQIKYGIPASVILAQMALESRWGQSQLAERENNYFGMKATKQWQSSGKPVAYYSDDRPNEPFKKYSNAQESINDYVRLMMSDTYKRCHGFASDDYRNWITGISAAGYATDKSYREKVIKTIEANNLDRFDKQAIELAREQKHTIGYKRGQNPMSESNSYAATQGQGNGEPQNWSMPLQRSGNLIMTSDIGHRDKPTPGASENHKGIDLRAHNDIVLATEDNGKVKAVNNVGDGKGGRTLTIEYNRHDGTKYEVTYMHLNEATVKVGDQVMAGSKVAISGNTGNSKGPHLHMEVRKTVNGKTSLMDPKEYLAEMAVRGNLSQKLISKYDKDKKDLLEPYKSDIAARIANEPKPEDNSLASNQNAPQSKEDAFMEWLKKLDPMNAGSFMEEGQQHQDMISGLLSSIFSGMLAMAAYLNAQDGITNNQANVDMPSSSDNITPGTVERKRGEVEANVTKMRDSASAQFEKESPEHDRGNSLRL